MLVSNTSHEHHEHEMKSHNSITKKYSYIILKNTRKTTIGETKLSVRSITSIHFLLLTSIGLVQLSRVH